MGWSGSFVDKKRLDALLEGRYSFDAQKHSHSKENASDSNGHSFALNKNNGVGLLQRFIDFVVEDRSSKKNRIKEFERDYSALLISLASAVKAGADPLVSLANAYKLFPKDSPMEEELLAFKDRLEHGLPEVDCINRFAEEIPLPDLPLFRSALILARKEGASLGPALERLAKVTRQRQSFRRKVRSAIAMQRLASIGIAISSVLILIIQYLANPDAMQAVFESPTASKIMIVGVGFIVGGIVWMRKLGGKTYT